MVRGGEDVGLLIAPRLSANMLEFTPVDESITSLCLQVREWILTMVCAYTPNHSWEYPPFFESLEKVLESAPTGNSIVLLGDFNAHVGNDSEMWRGGLPDLNLNGVQLLYFCASHSSSVTNTMFNDKNIPKRTWHQETLSRQSKIL